MIIDFVEFQDIFTILTEDGEPLPDILPDNYKKVFIFSIFFRFTIY
jgi:hypothetical protein